ncbi:MAG: hypothetical protein R3A52_15895 [Polyangiales bacterium]
MTLFEAHPGGRWAASGDFAGRVIVWDLDAGRAVYAFAPESRDVAGHQTRAR